MSASLSPLDAAHARTLVDALEETAQTDRQRTVAVLLKLIVVALTRREQ